VRILSLDGVGGLVVGALMVLFHGFLAELYGLSLPVFSFIAGANVAYGAYATTLAFRASRGHMPARRAVDALIVANASWTVVCLALLLLTRATAGVLGQLHIALEGTWVLVLAAIEARLLRPLTR